MTHEAICSTRETIQLARLSCINLGEDVQNLDVLLRMSDEELPEVMTIEDAITIHELTPAYFRR